MDEKVDDCRKCWPGTCTCKKEAKVSKSALSAGLCKKPLYLIVDREYRIYKSPVLSGYVRSQVRKGNLSVINLNRLKGMNCLKLHSDEGLQGDFGENEWSYIQDLPEGFEVDA